MWRRKALAPEVAEMEKRLEESLETPVKLTIQ
jgi:hypothetical protein